MKKLFIILFMALTSCASSGVVPMDNDVYMVGKRNAQICLAPPVGTKADAYLEANAFCARQNEKVETIKMNMINSILAETASV